MYAWEKSFIKVIAKLREQELTKLRSIAYLRAFSRAYMSAVPAVTAAVSLSVYAAAGGTGVGVLQTAADENILSIGVDSNQNYLHPGKVLTSMLKRVDNAVYNAMSQGAELETGFNVMGISNGGVGYALDEHNASLITADMQASVDSASSKIASGALSVHDYMSDNSCPVK